MKKKPVIAWHFVRDTLRDGSPIPKDGAWLTFKGACVMCQSGLHASRNPFDALQYAPGNTLCLVEVADIQGEQHSKLVCRRRKIIARMDARELCSYFGRMQALSAIHLWDAPDVVLDYLMTGDEVIRQAARDAANAAYAAQVAAWAAACDAAYAAQGTAYASMDAARSAWAAAVALDNVRGEGDSLAAAKNEVTQLVYECFEDYL